MASLWELGPVIFGPTEDFVSWLQNKGLLASSRTCSSCSGAVMRLGKRGDVSDGCVWRCPQCKITKSICEGSCFTKSRMPLKKWLLLLHCSVRQYPAKDAAEEGEVDPNTACDIYRYFVRLKMSIILCYVYRWFRETTLLNTTILLGGPGKIVKVDESLFRRKPKVKLSLIIILHF